MKSSLVLFLVSIAACAGVWAVGNSAVEMPANPPARSLQVLIESLSSESYREREQATQEVWELGGGALSVLKEAAASGDPEKAHRARELIRKIELFITPDTDPAVILLVERYAKASNSEKIVLFSEMRKKKAWHQILSLFAMEKNQELKARMQPVANAIAVRAARERLFQGDQDGARTFLELAPANAAGLLALAEFHRSHGTLEAELERTRSMTGPASDAWALALHRAAGNLQEARMTAEKSGQPLVAAAMAAMAGDPIPWLKYFSAVTQEEKPASSIYASLALKRWRGEKLGRNELKPLVKSMSARGLTGDERLGALNALFLLGENEAAESAYSKISPLAAFQYFETLERIPEALRALGFDPEQPDYASWVAQRAKELSAEEIENQTEISVIDGELLTLANFLERRGLHAEAHAAFEPPLKAMAEDDMNTFVDFLGRLFYSAESKAGAPQLARKIGLDWAGDDEMRWDELLVAAFGDSDGTESWWEWTAELDPKAGKVERFDGMLALFGLGNDPLNLRRKWVSLAWDRVGNTDGDERDATLEKLGLLAGTSGDVETGLKVWDLMEDSARVNMLGGARILQLSAVGRWNDAANELLNQVTRMTENSRDPSAELHALAAAALRMAARDEEAAGHDQWVDKLVLGDPELATRVGNAYAFGLDYARASEWWARAAREADPASGGFYTALVLYSDLLVGQGDWKRVAAMSEVITQVNSDAQFFVKQPDPLHGKRLQSDMAKALSMLGSDRAGAVLLLGECYRKFARDGSLADYFFPALREEGLIEEHDRWFLETWDVLIDIIDHYPECTNTRNTAAWFASRSNRKLDEAEAVLAKALELSPEQAAYLDTMAEIEFARGNREKALEWSEKAVNFSPQDPQLRRQQFRFRSGPLPK